MISAKRALLHGLLCWAAYVAGRTALQRLMPAQDWGSYVRQDLAVTALRLGCALGCLAIARRRWFDSALGLNGALGLKGWALAAVGVNVAAAALALGAHIRDMDQAWWVRAVEAGIALVVAVNEEIGFRGLLYSGLRELWGRSAAVVGQAALFALMHAGYQPGFHLGKVFVIGMTYGWLRDRGVSLKALIAVHFAVDALFALALTGAVVDWKIYGISLGLEILAAALAWKAPERHAAEGECLLFVYGTLKGGQAQAAEMGVPKRCDPIGSASAQGRLTERGGYPALTPGAGRVEGELLRLRDRDFLKLLDEYEGADYLRDRIEIKSADGGSVEAWAYLAA